jgi:hypothetical protein
VKIDEQFRIARIVDAGRSAISVPIEIKTRPKPNATNRLGIECPPHG